MKNIFTLNGALGMLSAISEEIPKFSVKIFFQRFLKRFRHKKISAQVTITYALILITVLVISNLFIKNGIEYLFHHQAARAIEISLNRMTKTLDEGGTILDTDAAFSGVIVRIIDERGNLIKDNSPLFPPTDKMLNYVVKDKPFVASKDYTLIETPHSFFYYTEVPLEVNGENIRVQVFKTITFEKELITALSQCSIILDSCGVILILSIGYLLMRKVLRPLKYVTETARKISKGDMNQRLMVDDSGNEVVELASSFNFMLDKIHESFLRQQQFIADASHELRTPVTVINGYADILKKFGAQDKELLDESITAIKNESDNLKNFLDSLLFLARVDQGNQPLDKLPIDVEKILREVVNKFNNPRVKFSGNGNFELLGDEFLLKKMFSAILDNALKYSNAEVTVKLETANNAATVHIIDSGIGISDEDKPKIFDRFFRADKSRTKSDEDKSVGLGLSVAKWIADNHGIAIKVDSEVGKGTDFILEIVE